MIGGVEGAVNVLLVVPFAEDLILLPKEAQDVINILQPRTVLQGDVTEDLLQSTIRNEVRSGGAYEGIWLAAHMKPTGVQLSDVLLQKDALVQYVGVSGARWVVLNGCESEGMAAGLTAIGVDVIAATMTEWNTGVDDRDAWRAAILIATALRENGGDLKAAYDQNPHLVNSHRFFSAAQHTNRSYQSDQQWVNMILARMDRMETKIEKLDEKLDAKIDGVGNRIDAIEKQIAGNQKVRTSAVNTFVVSLVIALGFLVMIVLSIYIMSNRGGM